jgi:hypothetical protein
MTVKLDTRERRLYWANFAGHAAEALLTVAARTAAPAEIAEKAADIADAMVREMGKRAGGSDSE